MPVKIRKLPLREKYRVYDGNRISAKETSLREAERQVRLLSMLHAKKK